MSDLLPHARIEIRHEDLLQNTVEVEEEGASGPDRVTELKSGAARTEFKVREIRGAFKCWLQPQAHQCGVLGRNLAQKAVNRLLVFRTRWPDELRYARTPPNGSGPLRNTIESDQSGNLRSTYVQNSLENRRSLERFDLEDSKFTWARFDIFQRLKKSG